MQKEFIKENQILKKLIKQVKVELEEINNNTKNVKPNNYLSKDEIVEIKGKNILFIKGYLTVKKKQYLKNEIF